jgi:hypothetical protein
VLFVVGSYHVGKERAYLGAAHALGWRVHCSPAKHRVGPGFRRRAAGGTRWPACPRSMPACLPLHPTSTRPLPALLQLLRLLGLPRHWLDLVTAVPEEAQVGARMAAPWLACAAPRVLCVAG